MKKIIGLSLILVILLLAGCALLTSNSSAALEEDYDYDVVYVRERLGLGAAMDELLEDNSVDDILECLIDKIGYGEFEYCLYECGYIDYDIPIVLDEISYSGCYEDYNTLIDICDHIGYYPNALLGTYYLDRETNMVHCTRSECFDSVNFEHFYALYMPKKEYITSEMSDSDGFLENATFCSTCFPPEEIEEYDPNQSSGWK